MDSLHSSVWEKMAVYLVAENVRARLARDLHDLFEHIAAHERAGRIVGVVDADHFVPGTASARSVKIGEIPVFAAQGRIFTFAPSDSGME